MLMPLTMLTRGSPTSPTFSAKSGVVSREHPGPLDHLGGDALQPSRRGASLTPELCILGDFLGRASLLTILLSRYDVRPATSHDKPQRRLTTPWTMAVRL